MRVLIKDKGGFFLNDCVWVCAAEAAWTVAVVFACLTKVVASAGFHAYLFCLSTFIQFPLTLTPFTHFLRLFPSLPLLLVLSFAISISSLFFFLLDILRLKIPFFN